ncbi:hypothetical protein [Actinoplanes sp. NPDC051859]|uniref:hypothetical protein n=1 Tax=Actinoplanes sp. NPDC051859 TaxID=3363909 RepID=UPI0037A2EE7A
MTRALRLRWSIAVVATALAGCLALLLPTGTPTPQTVARIAAVDLVDDASGALFSADDLVPESVVTRCLKVGYSGAAGAGAVRLAAEDLSGTLVPYLRVTVRSGTGGGYADCTGFAGTQVYAGPLSGLSVDSGVDSGWTASGTAEERTFAITVRVDGGNAAQAKSAGGTFAWFLEPPADPTSPTSPAPTSRSADPTSPPSTSGSPAPTTPAASVPPSSVPPTSSPAPSAPSPSGPAPTVAAPAEPPTSGDDSDPLDRALDAAGRLAAEVARYAAIPLLSVLIMLIFLAAQDTIDRNDPKLALAPLTRQRYAHFGDPDQQEHR